LRRCLVAAARHNRWRWRRHRRRWRRRWRRRRRRMSRLRSVRRWRQRRRHGQRRRRPRWTLFVRRPWHAPSSAHSDRPPRPPLAVCRAPSPPHGTSPSPLPCPQVLLSTVSSSGCLDFLLRNMMTLLLGGLASSETAADLGNQSSAAAITTPPCTARIHCGLLQKQKQHSPAYDLRTMMSGPGWMWCLQRAPFSIPR